jgi:hypothetical protein
MYNDFFGFRERPFCAMHHPQVPSEQQNQLTALEVAQFVRDRLQAVGYSCADLFTPGALDCIAFYAKGVPQDIDIVCDNALLLAYSLSQKTITVAIVKEVALYLHLPKLLQQDTDEVVPQTASPNIDLEQSQAQSPSVPLSHANDGLSPITFHRPARRMVWTSTAAAFALSSVLALPQVYGKASFLPTLPPLRRNIAIRDAATPTSLQVASPLFPLPTLEEMPVSTRQGKQLARSLGSEAGLRQAQPKPHIRTDSGSVHALPSASSEHTQRGANPSQTPVPPQIPPTRMTAAKTVDTKTTGRMTSNETGQPADRYAFNDTTQGASNQEFLGQRFKLTGNWRDGTLRVTRIQSRRSKDDNRRVQIAGLITSIDQASVSLQMGPFQIYWNAETKFHALTIADMQVQRGIEIRGTLGDDGRILATDIEPDLEISSNCIEVIGNIHQEERQNSGIIRVQVAGITADLPRSVYARSSGLVRRPDERRPDEQFTIPVWNRPLTIGGEFATTARSEGNRKLRKHADDDDARLEQELTLEFFYPLSESTLFFLKGKAAYEAKFRLESGRREVSKSLRRDQAWLYFSNVFDSRFSLQVGRQNFREDREWWWDDNLDAVRLHYDLFKFHAELGLAQELMPTSTEENGVDPTKKNVFRLLGNAAWRWGKDQQLDGFLLYNLDYSRGYSLGRTVRNDREDKSDAKLLWLGARASGEWDADRFGDLNYLVQGAWVGGSERLFTFDDNEAGKNSVVSRRRQRVSGWAVDSWLSWKLPVAWEPTLTLGYAFGSGDRTNNRKNGAFRQTGLQDNQGRWNGVKRYRYYGEFLRPELSNLHIWTAALGFRFWRSSSIDLAYHYYRQVHAADILRNARLDIDPQGKRRTIGEEWDMILAMREWTHVDVILIGSLFRAGAAYGSARGNLAYGLSLELNYNF